MASVRCEAGWVMEDTENREHSRHDQVRDINWTMTILANSIKVVSAVLTILAVDQTDR